MPCNCKNNSNTVGKQPITAPTPIVVQSSLTNEIPPYTREDLIKVKDALNSSTITEETKSIISNFNLQYFGEVIGGYCNQTCRERVLNRLEIALKRIQDYEATLK